MSGPALLSLAALALSLCCAQPPRPPTPPPTPPSPLRPLALFLQPPAAANLIPGGRYAASRPGLNVGSMGYSRDKTGNWPFVFPSSGKAATKTSVTTKTSTVSSSSSSSSSSSAVAMTSTIASPAPTAATADGDSPTLPLRADAVPSRAANIATVDGFSQVFGRGNSVLDEPQVSRCVWAIVTCCSPDSRAVRYGCFEQSGCHGAFWGTSPCDRHIARSAIDAALQFYL